MRKLKSKVLKLLSTLLVLTLVLVPFTTNVDAETSTKTSSLPIYCYSRYGRKNITVYTQTNTSSPVQGEITPDKYIKIVNMNTSGWAKVTYPTEQGNKTGYFLLNTLFINPNFSDKWVYLKGATKSTYTVYRKYLLRTKFGTIKGDNRVKIIGTDKGNTQILYQRRGGGYYLGWIKGEWSPTSIKPKIPKNKSIKLSVPKYTQYDSRWKNVKLGKSSKTIGQVGCTTTCLAMSESYLTKTTIYPNKMSKKLKYTSGGALYWPSNYTLKSSNNYLSEIYNQLKKGKPVLVGAKTSKGSQHWVIVTGYNGNGINKASSYTINDPGYRKKTNLQQHFDKYTKFYKIAYRK